MIYAYLFERSKKKRLEFLNPSKPSDIKIGLSDSLAFFRTCKSLQAEAAASLYGQNVFSFDDHYFWTGREPKPTQNSCGVTSMSGFLSLIGPLNRRSIGYIRIHINRATYFHYKGEFNYSATGHARFLGDAFDLLSSQGHSLKKLEIRVIADCVARFLRPIGESLLLRKLTKLSGGLRFRLSQQDGKPWDMDDLALPQDGSLLYKHLQEYLAGPRLVQTFGSPIEKQAYAISTEVLVISNRYGGLQKSVKAAEKQMMEWTGDESWTQMMNVLVMDWKAQLEQMEDALGSMEGTVGAILRNKALENQSSNMAQHNQRLKGTANKRLGNNVVGKKHAHRQDTMYNAPRDGRSSQNLQVGMLNAPTGGRPVHNAANHAVNNHPGNQGWFPDLQNQRPNGAANEFLVDSTPGNGPPSQNVQDEDLIGTANLYPWDPNWEGFHQDLPYDLSLFDFS